MIFLDDRQGSGELATLFQLPCTLCRLEYADAMFFGNGPQGGVSIGVERKKIHDLVDSISTGRLSAHQLTGLTDSYDAVYLIVEGYWRAGESGILETLNSRHQWAPIEHGKRRYMYRDIAAYLNSAMITAHAHVLRTSTPRETVLWIESIFKSWSKLWTDHTIFKKFQDVPLERANLVPPTVTRRMLKELSKVGWEKSKDLEKVFPSMESLIWASPKDIAKVPGFGKKLAQTVYDELRGKSS